MPVLFILLFLGNLAFGTQTLKATVGQKFTITMDSNPTTGYSW